MLLNLVEEQLDWIASAVEVHSLPVPFGGMFARELCSADRRAPWYRRRRKLAREATARATPSVFSIGGDSDPLLVHVHNGRVDHLRADSECVHHLIPGPSHPPANEAIIAFISQRRPADRATVAPDRKPQIGV